MILVACQGIFSFSFQERKREREGEKREKEKIIPIYNTKCMKWNICLPEQADELCSPQAAGVCQACVYIADCCKFSRWWHEIDLLKYLIQIFWNTCFIFIFLSFSSFNVLVADERLCRMRQQDIIESPMMLACLIRGKWYNKVCQELVQASWYNPKG